MLLKNNRKLVTTSYAWDISNFGYLEMLSLPGDILRCPLLNPRNSKKACKFYIYPKGKFSEDYISFYLSTINPLDQSMYNCTLSIGRPDSTPVKTYKFINVRFVDKVIGEDCFLLKKLNSWIFRGPVRFRCDITEISSENHDLFHVYSYKPIGFNLGVPDCENLSLDLEELLMIPFNSDLTVNISGNEIYVHKYILYARCPNLCYEFGYRSIEEMPPSVEIQISLEIFEFLMHYIYTGKLQDLNIPLELYRYAERLRLLSLIQCLYQQAYSYHVHTEVEVENQVISWNLNELNFQEEDSTFVHILRTTLYVQQLAVQVSVLDGCGNEKFIHISFKFLRLLEYKPITLVCKISLASQAGLEAFKEEHHVFSWDEQWNFPRLKCQKDNENMCLTAELSISDASYTCELNNIETKIKLYTGFQTVHENLESLRGNMGHLYDMEKNASNLILLSADNQFFRVHDAIMWARWPGVRKLIDVSSVSSDEEINETMSQLELQLPSEVLNILLSYMYTGFISYFDKAKAEILLKYSNCAEYPNHLVKKCEAILSANLKN